MEAQKRYNLNHIPFVFSDTGIELGATKKFVKDFPYDNVQIIYPKDTKTKMPVSFAETLTRYGKPMVSKLKSDWLQTVQNTGDPLLTKRGQNLIGYGEFEDRSHHQLGFKHYHLLHPDNPIKISAKCCEVLKKNPFKQYIKENKIDGYFLGVRVDEGGVRSLSYQSCTESKEVDGRQVTIKMPLIDWSNETVEEYIKHYNLKLSDAYEVYGCVRTGCFLCPFSQDIRKDMQILYKYEYNKYKASLAWLGDVYIQQGVVLEWDEEYMKKFKEAQPAIERMRLEMLKKFKPDAKSSRKQPITKTSLL